MDQNGHRTGPGRYERLVGLVGAGLLTAAVAGTLALACNGGDDGDPTPVKDTYPYETGTVVDKADGRLRLRYPPTGVTGWQPVSGREYSACQAGETWRDSDPDGCA